MKKISCKMLALMLTLVMCVSLVQVVYAQPDAFYDGEDMFAEEFVSFYDVMIAEFGFEFTQNHVVAVETLDTFMDSLPRSRTGDVMFPDSFGGAYIDEDGNAVVLIVAPSVFVPFAMDYSLAQVQRSDTVIIREVDFPYSDLLVVMEVLNHLICEFLNPEVKATVHRWSVDVIGNRVVVELADLTDDMVLLFRTNILDSPVIVFEQSYGESIIVMPDFELANISLDYTSYSADQQLVGIEPFMTVRAAPGDPVIFRRGAPLNPQFISTGSIGYRATSGSRRGFVTAAHIALNFDAQPLRAGDRAYCGRTGIQLGFVTHSQLDGVDAAFIELNPSVEINDTVMGFRIVGQAIPNLYVGQVVHSVGTNLGSTTHRTGRIERLNHSTTFTGRNAQNVIIWQFTIRNVLETTILSLSGHSGGIVFAVTSGGTPVPIGIHSGSNHERTRSLAPRYNEISRLLGVSLR